MTDRNARLTELLELSHTLGDPAHDWAILGEGNTSTFLDTDTFLVKASGSELRTLTAEQISEVRFAPVLDALNGTRDYTDTETKDLLLGACVGGTGRMPSVETLLHAYLLTLPGIAFIGHTHRDLCERPALLPGRLGRGPERRAPVPGRDRRLRRRTLLRPVRGPPACPSPGPSETGSSPTLRSTEPPPRRSTSETTASSPWESRLGRSETSR